MILRRHLISSPSFKGIKLAIDLKKLKYGLWAEEQILHDLWNYQYYQITDLKLSLKKYKILRFSIF